RCQRDVDQEHRFPTEGAREHATEQDADHEASRACAAPDPQCAVSITTFCEGGVDNRQGAREDKGTAQTLNRARGELDFGPRSKAPASEAKAYSARPMTSMRRLPSKSAARPPNNRKPLDATAYALTTDCSV